MAFDKETAARLESLYRQHLEEAFQRTLTFHPITVEVTQNMFDQDAFHVTVVYHGDGRLLDPAKLNRISSLVIDRAAELGIENTILESYVDGQEPSVDEPVAETGGNQPWQEMLNIARCFLRTGNLPNKAELSLGVDGSYFAMYHALEAVRLPAIPAGRHRNPVAPVHYIEPSAPSAAPSSFPIPCRGDSPRIPCKVQNSMLAATGAWASWPPAMAGTNEPCS